MKTGRVHQVVVSFTVRSLLNFAGVRVPGLLVVSRPETAQNSASFPAGRGTLKGGTRVNFGYQTAKFTFHKLSYAAQCQHVFFFLLLPVLSLSFPIADGVQGHAPLSGVWPLAGESQEEQRGYRVTVVMVTRACASGAAGIRIVYVVLFLEVLALSPVELCLCTFVDQSNTFSVNLRATSSHQHNLGGPFVI